MITILEKMSYQAYQGELNRLKPCESVQTSKELNCEIDALCKILFAGPEVTDESYTKVIVALLNKVKSYQLSQLEYSRTMVSQAQRKSNRLDMQQRRLGEIKTSYGEIIAILNKIVDTQCLQ